VASLDTAPWHQALAYAILGRRLAELGRQNEPDVTALARRLRENQDLAASVGALRDAGAWPVPVPAELMIGLGRAQFAAALAALVKELALDAQGLRHPADRRPDVDELRLLEELPPHHIG